MAGLGIGVPGALGTGSGTLHDVEVDHGGGDVGVPHEVLYGADVGTVFKEMGSEAVTKYMRRDVFWDVAFERGVVELASHGILMRM